MKEKLKITIKNNNGTEFSYWMHSSGYITLTEKDIEDLLKDIEMPFIGEVSPGCYQIGKGMYTGKLGFIEFEKELYKQIRKDGGGIFEQARKQNLIKIGKFDLKALLQTKKK